MGQIEHKREPTTTFVPTATSVSQALTRDRFFLATIAVLVILLAFIVLFPLRTASDVALYIDGGGRVLDGQRPYIDFFDINPPTIHFLNALSVAFSRITGAQPILSFHVFIWLTAAAACFSTGFVLARAHREDRLGRLQPWLIPTLMALGAYVTWLLVMFGQRDHIFLLALLMWGVLRWYRWEGGQPPVGLAVLTGIIAAIGASLKPTFALSFGLLEIYGLVRYRRWRAYFTWELVGVGIIVGLYGLYFVTQPDILRTYLTEVGPSVVEGYRGYGYVPAINLIFGDFQSLLTLGLSALLMLLGLRQRAALGRLFFVIAILGLATVLSFVLQTKGWRYHALPMLNLIFLMGGLLLVQAFMRPRLRILLRRRRLDTVFLAATIIVCVLIGVMLAPEFIYGEARDAEQMPFLHYSQPGDAVIVADIEVVTVYPAVIQTGRIPVGRYPMAYPLAFAYANLSALPDDVYAASHTPPPLAQTYLDVLMDDIEQKQPPLILLRANTRSDVATYVNLAEYIKAHTDIEPLLARQYDYQGIASGYEVYVRKAGL